MAHTLAFNQPLQSILWSKTNTLPKEILLVIAGVFLLALSAHISIPIQPVPLTFQSTAVILIGMIYGTRLGAYTLCAYLFAGAVGLPVLAEVPIVPNLGYLLGFLPAAMLSGYLAQKGWAKNVIGSFIASCLSTSIIFLFGVSVLSTFIGIHNAIAAGLLPFIFTEPMKLVAVSLIVPKFWRE